MQPEQEPVSVVKVIKNVRGNDHLLTEDNHRYRKDKEHDDHINWRCLDKKCRARLHTDLLNNVIFTSEAGHNHVSDVREVEKQKVYSTWKLVLMSLMRIRFNF